MRVFKMLRKMKFCPCLSGLSMLQLFLVIFVLFMTVPLVTHYYISNIGGDTEQQRYLSRSKLDYDKADLDPLKPSKLESEINDLQRIKVSVNNELRTLESKRQKIRTEISGYEAHVEALRTQYESLNKEMNQVKLALEQLKLEKEDAVLQYIPNIKAPQRILTDLNLDVNEIIPKPTSILSQSCRMHTCFDYSICSLVSRFPIFVYNSQEVLTDSFEINEFVASSVIKVFGKNAYITEESYSACIYILVVGELENQNFDKSALESMLHNLPYWHGDGRNHVLINLASNIHNIDILSGINTGRAIVVQSAFIDSVYRTGFDLVIPPLIEELADGPVWQELPPLAPVRRKYFISFRGQSISPPQNQGKFFDSFNEGLYKINQHNQNQFRRRLKSVSDVPTIVSIETQIVQALKDMVVKMPQEVHIALSCDKGSPEGVMSEWALCGTKEQRSEILKESTFSILVAPNNFSIVSTTGFQTRLSESLKYGAVPIILGTHVTLPYSEILDWDKAVVFLPTARVTEIFFFLRTFTDNDISFFRHRGRFIWETYFATTENIIDSALAVLRTRLQIPPRPVKAEPAPSVFNASFIPLKYNGPETEPETDEFLGPKEERFASEEFKRNYTKFFFRDSFNQPGDPFHLYPYTPIDPLLSADARFLGSGFGYRPIGHGVGGAGKEFSESLGGNVQREQFTIVMLTYEREEVLMNALKRLKYLPFLNRVIVVWNNQIPPSVELRWPDIGVPLNIVKTAKNSLNNRFLPFDIIETEAVLSIDDDAHLRHDEIIFGFRVWREERDRVVGFPGRFHTWDVKNKSWLYNSNYSCELSMVLTGAAFYHKYYAYLYTYSMPQAIRDKVDEYTNCEDIAMNFLVSHITRKPPIKVTSRWTFRCPGCPQTLSSDDSHFQERHQCINFFVKVYGYMPLLFTQYRVDSVLFKTRLPHDKQKCFKYI
ncbi:exostosin-like 3 [Patella vulgata]|uniref:exostosin-like 3 n=1 Tax=Patella vulgata TaxID=6465 RepID=UPI00217F99A4|nr:exostosin-like 3 [Patella vulgata]XP_050409239.1 exostosin-like 3 [Patella vulgata]